MTKIVGNISNSTKKYGCPWITSSYPRQNECISILPLEVWDGTKYSLQFLTRNKQKMARNKPENPKLHLCYVLYFIKNLSITNWIHLRWCILTFFTRNITVPFIGSAQKISTDFAISLQPVVQIVSLKKRSTVHALGTLSMFHINVFL